MDSSLLDYMMGHKIPYGGAYDRWTDEDIRSQYKKAENSIRLRPRFGVGPEEIDVAELHDAFTVLEIAESEAAGFFPRGEGHVALEQGVTSLGGAFPINPSGGLKGRGHPVGATGVAQLVELTWQLRGDAGTRQVAGARNGFACNFGGFGNNVVATVLRSERRDHG